MTSQIGDIRRNLLRLLSMRMTQLMMQNVPSEYYVGQEYVEDPRHAESTIVAHAQTSGHVPPFEFWIYGAHISVKQHGCFIVFFIKKKISQRLWDEMRLIGRGERFIVGYLYSYLPYINKRLLELRYSQGHILVNTAAIHQLLQVKVICQNRILQISWPMGFMPFPPNATIAPEISDLYIRDYIDACHAYFQTDYDGCIRKVITSAENFFTARMWDPKRISRWRMLVDRALRKPHIKSKFRLILHDNLDLTVISGEVIYQNMSFIYRLRNKIVHSDFRVPPHARMICNKALGTLKYMLLRNSGDSRKSNYIHHLHMQFMMQCSAFGEEANLDVIRNRANKPISPAFIINSPADLERAMFSSLRFDENERKII